MINDSTQYGRPGNSNAGFSLVEMLAVLVLMGIVGVLVVNRIGDSAAAMNARAALVKSHLRYAQARAMNSDSIWGIRYSSIANNYYLFEYDAAGVENPRLLPGEEALNIALSDEKLVFSGFNNPISFDQWGRPCSDAAGAVPAGGAFSVNAGSRSVAVTVTPETGFIP